MLLQIEVSLGESLPKYQKVVRYELYYVMMSESHEPYEALCSPGLILILTPLDNGRTTSLCTDLCINTITSLLALLDAVLLSLPCIVDIVLFKAHPNEHMNNGVSHNST